MWAQDAVAIVWLCGCVARVAVDSVRGAARLSAGAQAVASAGDPNDWWLVRLLGSLLRKGRRLVRLLGRWRHRHGAVSYLDRGSPTLQLGGTARLARQAVLTRPGCRPGGVSADLAQVGRLSVPPGWAVAAPALHAESLRARRRVVSAEKRPALR